MGHVRPPDCRGIPCSGSGRWRIQIPCPRSLGVAAVEFHRLEEPVRMRCRRQAMRRRSNFCSCVGDSIEDRTGCPKRPHVQLGDRGRWRRGYVYRFIWLGDRRAGGPAITVEARVVLLHAVLSALLAAGAGLRPLLRRCDAPRTLPPVRRRTSRSPNRRE